MQDVSKLFGGVIDLYVCDFCEFFSDFLSNLRAFSDISLLKYNGCSFVFASGMTCGHTNCGYHLKTMQNISKLFGGVIDLSVYDFCEFFSDFFEQSEGIF